ncbi:MAG: hypothetical protein OQK77_12875 [Psychromonas sp.]|nr:hypothetical protein [Psychromonas sp.]
MAFIQISQLIFTLIMVIKIKGEMMNSWLLFLLIVVLFAFIIHNAILLAKMKLPESVKKTIAEKKKKQSEAAAKEKSKHKGTKKDQ